MLVVIFNRGGASGPPLTVTINQAAGQPDPADASPINFTVVFSGAVADFVTGDVTLTGTAGATTAIVTGSGTTYNVAVSGMTGAGTVIATIGAGVAQDGNGTLNDASTSTDNTVTWSVTPAPSRQVWTEKDEVWYPTVRPETLWPLWPRLGTLTRGSPVVTELSATSGLAPGVQVSGVGIPNATTIVTVDSSSQITLSQPATEDGRVLLSFTPARVEPRKASQATELRHRVLSAKMKREKQRQAQILAEDDCLLISHDITLGLIDADLVSYR